MRNELHYVVDEEKRTVTCVAFDCELDLVFDLFKKLAGVKTNVRNFLFEAVKTDELLEQFLLSKTYVGKATCSHLDTWDEEKGKSIARKKMRIKYNKAKRIKMNRVMKFFNKINNVFNEMNIYSENKIEESIMHLANEINSLN